MGVVEIMLLMKACMIVVIATNSIKELRCKTLSNRSDEKEAQRLHQLPQQILNSVLKRQSLSEKVEQDC